MILGYTSPFLLGRVPLTRNQREKEGERERKRNNEVEEGT